MNLIVKNMVCQRCIIVVSHILAAMQLDTESVTMGQISLKKDISSKELDLLDANLRQRGFEILDDRKRILTEKVKNKIIEIVHGAEAIHLKINFSQVIKDVTGLEYSSVSTLFSGIEGCTIEQYIILQRVERAKELLLYDELSLGEIAQLLGYSSMQHLSTQFKKVTGTTPSAFKKQRTVKRMALDAL